MNSSRPRRISDRGPIAVSAGGWPRAPELRHLRMSAEVLLHGALPMDDDDRARVERVYQDVRCALVERTP
jgi:hypothetical protein